MGLKSGYKQTEVGIIPEDWEVEPLGSITQPNRPISYGIVQTGPNLPNGIRCIRVVDVESGRINEEGLITTSRQISDSYKRTILQAGDVIMPLRGKVGDIAFVTEGLAGCNLTRGLALIAIRDEYSHIYCGQYVRSPTTRARLAQSMNGSALQEIPIATLRSFKIAHPRTRAEQEAIAGALSDADALIESLEQLLVKKRHLKQGAMQELLTGKKRLPGFADKWMEQTLLQLAEGKKELFDDGDWVEAEHITHEGVRLVQTGNIGTGTFIEKAEKKYIFEKSFASLRCKEIRQGDLLICRLAEPAGRSCLLPDIGESKIITSVDVTIFRPSASVANRVFLTNVFSTDRWFQEVSHRSGGTTHKRISRGALGRLKVKIPCVNEQNAIAEILSDMDAELATLEGKLSKARQLKQGMMQELLTGRIRLL